MVTYNYMTGKPVTASAPQAVYNTQTGQKIGTNTYSSAASTPAKTTSSSSSSSSSAPKTTSSSSSGNLSVGSSGAEVKALQQKLGIPADGIFGPQTQTAVKNYQASQGLSADGIVGPLTQAKLSAAPAANQSLPTTVTATPSTQMITATGELNPNFIPQTPEENAAVAKIQRQEAIKDPVFAGNSPAALEYAALTGDFSGLLNEVGQPFSVAEQQSALRDSEAALAPGYDIAKQKETADTEQALKDQQRTFGEYQDTQGLSFEEDKAAADQNAADSGVLFSGSRVQKEQSLANKYTTDMESKRAGVASNISTLGRGFQSKYGDEAAKGLSSYYSLGQSAYNPKVATGGSSKGGLSSVYNPAGLGYQGTEYVANKAAAQKRAAGLLWNKGNKLLSTGSANQYK